MALEIQGKTSYFSNCFNKQLLINVLEYLIWLIAFVYSSDQLLKSIINLRKYTSLSNHTSNISNFKQKIELKLFAQVEVS